MLKVTYIIIYNWLIIKYFNYADNLSKLRFIINIKIPLSNKESMFHSIFSFFILVHIT